jgi:hypothetical protein
MIYANPAVKLIREHKGEVFVVVRGQKRPIGKGELLIELYNNVDEDDVGAFVDSHGCLIVNGPF